MSGGEVIAGGAGRERIAVKLASSVPGGLLDKLRKKLFKDIETDSRNIEKRIVFTEHPELTTGKSKNFYPDAKTQTIEKQIEKMLQEIYDEIKAKWIPGQSSGRLDIPKIISMEAQAGDIWDTKIFKQYQISGLDEVRMGVVIILDSSGSMSAYVGGGSKMKSRLDLAKDACWALSTAFEKKGNNPVGIIIFSTGPRFPRVAKKFNRPGNWSFVPDSGTDNFPAMKWGENMLRQINHTEQIKNLYLVLISDGELDHSAFAKTTEMFERFKKAKGVAEIKSMEIHVGLAAPFAGADYQILISDFDKFPKQFAEILKKIQLDLYKKLRR